MVCDANQIKSMIDTADILWRPIIQQRYAANREDADVRRYKRLLYKYTYDETMTQDQIYATENEEFSTAIK